MLECVCLFSFNELYNSAGWGESGKLGVCPNSFVSIFSSSDFSAVSVVDVEDRQ